MGEEKRNRITAALTINAVLLIFILLAVIIAQIVTISVKTRRKNALLNEYYSLEQQLEAAEKLRDELGTEDGQNLLEILRLTDDLQAVLEQLLQMNVNPKK